MHSYTNFRDRILPHKKRLDNVKVHQMMATDEGRAHRFSREIDLAGDVIYFNYSRQRIDDALLAEMQSYLLEVDMMSSIEKLFAGGMVNFTEDRAAHHTKLRSRDSSIFGDSQQLRQLDDFSKKCLDDGIEKVVNVGIGGSYLGIKLLSDAFSKSTDAIELDFLSRLNPEHFDEVIARADFQKTAFVFCSKSFGTEETLIHLEAIKKIFAERNLDYSDYFFAVTLNKDRAKSCGILPENIYQIPNSIGGRYSIWSSMAAACYASLGSKQYGEFLKGAALMDEHFLSADFSDNIPILMAFIDIWNSNFLGYGSLSLAIYDDKLTKLVDYLQQLVMESCGKSVDSRHKFVDYPTSPVIWGGRGNNAQHSYFQALHQATTIVPVEFYLSYGNTEQWNDHKIAIIANCLAQSAALMLGSALNTDDIRINHRVCRGNKPSNMIMFKEVTPGILGALLAMWEHRVFIQSQLLDINAFDQWGVELGKTISRNINQSLRGKQKIADAPDIATSELINYINNHSKTF